MEILKQSENWYMIPADEKYCQEITIKIFGGKIRIADKEFDFKVAGGEVILEANKSSLIISRRNSRSLNLSEFSGGTLIYKAILY